MKLRRQIAAWMLATTVFTGCGGDRQPSQEASSPPDAPTTGEQFGPLSPKERTKSGSGVVPASGQAKSQSRPASAEEESDLDLTQPDKDSPEWFILQITRLKLRPLGDSVDAFSQTPERQAELRRQRNEQLVNLATEAIARTHKDSARQRVFDLAVHHLLEAELQLALTGDQEHIDAIYDHASSLFERDPVSKAAVEGGQALISLARINAQQFGQQDSKWLVEYARLTRQFSKNFPQEERLVIPALMAAGQSCENHGLNAEAIQCYAIIRDQFPENAAVEPATACLRRLNLKGQHLQLSGPTIGGEFFNADDMLGKPLLVVFWTTQAQPFVRQLPSLRSLLEQIDAKRLNVVSINLDDDDNEAAVQTFLESNQLHWPTIFETASEKRGWNNPIAAYYGIQSVPQFWIVSSKGIVVETANSVKQIEPLLEPLKATAKP
jgi:hypothetical protein